MLRKLVRIYLLGEGRRGAGLLWEEQVQKAYGKMDRCSHAEDFG
jgi:hypothetical protein